MRTSLRVTTADVPPAAPERSQRRLGRGDWVRACLLLFASGAAGLAHQILWTRRMVDVLGASTDTFSKVVGAFFLGLAIGGGWSALKPAVASRAWRRVAGAELAVAVLGLLVLSAVPAADLLRSLPEANRWLRFVLPVVLITPPAIAMGLVLPAVVAAGADHGTAIWYYAINTLGGVVGIGAVVFVGLPTLGLLGAGLVTCGVNLAVALVALGWPAQGTFTPGGIPGIGSTNPSRLSLGITGILAFASGFLVLGLEVVGQHQFAQVTINSHFSSATVLALVLLALTLSALVVACLPISFHRLLATALILSAGASLLEPVAFLALRPGLQIIPYELRPGPYFAAVGLLALGTLTPVFLAAGLLFPTLLREANDARSVAGLVALNGLGGWFGAELTPAMVLPALGLWRSVIGAGLLYGGLWAGISILGRRPKEQKGKSAVLWHGMLATIGVTLFGFALIQAKRWPQVSPSPDERVVEVALGQEGVVATVVHQTNDWRIIFNNTYTLGGSRAQANQERQAHLPLLLHGHPQTIALLGVATGSTLAGAAQHAAIERIDAFELSPLVARFAREHFVPFNRQVFGDSRIHLAIEDARWGVSQNPDQYDVVIGDLFLPWRTGEGRLFTQEHFAAVHRSLKPGGLFCQWLPLFQLTRPQFDLIARTFRQEFTNTFLLRGDFYAELPILGLCGFADGRPLADLDWSKVAAACARLRTSSVTDPLVRHEEGVAMCLIGELPGPPPGPINTLSNARLEWEAGKNIVGLQTPWFVGVPAAEYVREAVRSSSSSLPAALRTAHDSGQYFLTLEIAAKVNAPVLANLRAQILERLPPALKMDSGADWQSWPMRIKPYGLPAPERPTP